MGGGVGKQLAWVVGVVGGLRGEFETGEVGRDFVMSPLWERVVP